MLLDTCYRTEIPEGTELPLHCAGPWVRSAAFMLDLLIRAVIYGALGSLLALLGLQRGTTAGVMMIAVFLLEWFYPVLFEIGMDGMTPGKHYCKIKVINEDGTPVGLRASLVRNLLRTVDFLPLLYVTGVIACISSATFQRLGDMAAGTVVVYHRNSSKPPQWSQAGSRSLPFSLSVDEQNAVIDFAERSHKLSPARAQEVAALLAPFLRSDEEAVVQIKQLANALLGRH
jgi:uncharacterized RDD family membrane protein YckC